MEIIMEYRILGRTNVKVSEIGMGTEHLLDKDEQTVIGTIKSALSGGVTYFDCHPGHDKDDNSIHYGGYDKLGKALELADDREGLCLTYLAGVSLSPADTQPRFESFLKSMKLDYIDVFILQFCDKASEYSAILAEGGLLDYAKSLKSQGRIKYIGFSTHSSGIAFQAIASGDIDVLMYPVNPAFDVVIDEDKYKSDKLETLWDAASDYSAGDKTGAQPRKSVYAECQREGVGLVAMKPFAGGFIFGVEEAAGFTPVNLISYVLSQNGVSTVVPGCTCPREIEEILEYYNLPPEALDYSGAVAKSRWSVMENCLYCNHCLPCGAGINIAEVNRLLDAYEASKSNVDSAGLIEKYNALAVKASACIECGVCEERCPFRVKVIGRMGKAVCIFE